MQRGQGHDFGIGTPKVKPPNSLAEWIQAMPEMTTAVPKAPGIPSAKCYRYTWVVRGFWDFARKRAGAAPGITWQRHHTVLMEIPEVAVVLAMMAMVVAVVLAIANSNASSITRSSLDLAQLN